MPDLQKIEGVSLEEFFEKCKNFDKEFPLSAEDAKDDSKKNKIDSLRRVYDAQRFMFDSKMFREDDLAALKNPKRILEFVDKSTEGKLEAFYEQMKPKKEKFSIKIAGKDFEKRVFEQNRDSLVLIYHSEPEKNRGIKQKFE